jgi:hypothetical protein
MLRAVLLLAAVMLGGLGPGALAAGGSGNSANDNLLAMSPDEQVKMLTKGIKGCVGESPDRQGEGLCVLERALQGRQKLCRSNHPEGAGDRGGMQSVGGLRQGVLQEVLRLRHRE